jgi:hypothetical protein
MHVCCYVLTNLAIDTSIEIFVIHDIRIAYNLELLNK